jgi:8-oxo-dGTP pyrophosphatase MutT (NUDIX family)
VWFGERGYREVGNVKDMEREISAGGVVVRQWQGEWQAALIEPRRSTGQRAKPVFALPKGLLDPGEKAQDAAVREVREETGLSGSVVKKLGDVKYTYTRTWAGGEKVFKIVSYYLLRYEMGEIDDLAGDMRIEVKRALWVPLEEASRKLSYSTERKILREAEAYVAEHGEDWSQTPS